MIMMVLDCHVGNDADLQVHCLRMSLLHTAIPRALCVADMLILLDSSKRTAVNTIEILARPKTFSLLGKPLSLDTDEERGFTRHRDTSQGLRVYFF
jgi:hypothetical protein